MINLATGRVADTGGNEPKAFELGGQACSQAVTAGAVEQLEADLLRLRSGIDRRLLGCLPRNGASTAGAAASSNRCTCAPEDNVSSVVGTTEV